MAKKVSDKYEITVSGRIYDAKLRREININHITIEDADACFKAGCTWIALKPKEPKNPE